MMVRQAVILAYALFLGMGAAARAAPSDNAALNRIAVTLRPGQFAWTEAAASLPDPPMIAVSLALQRLYVYRGGELVGVAAISSGRPGHATPLGDYRILEKALRHRSNIYSNAPMPFMQRLTWGGIALHAGVNPGYPASHGCIRLPHAFARDLFRMTGIGATVTITDYPLEPPIYLRVDALQIAEADTAALPLAFAEETMTLGYSETVFAL